MTTIISEQHVGTPLGDFVLLVSAGTVVAAHMFDDAGRTGTYLRRHYANGHVVRGKPDSRIAGCVDAYFGGDIRALRRIPIDPRGTPFQTKVWSALLAIEPGETVAYAEVADAVGAPRAFRAVGQANRANPISIIVPCHRVVGKDGALTGYGGDSRDHLRRKAWLIRHEQRWAKDPPVTPLGSRVAPVG
jgi:methylated-DNA-[protein]-cysteine S-methyltransferase